MQRAEVGTVYKKQGREAAVTLGRDFVQPKLEQFIDESLRHAPDGKAAVHCWRGGMRSQAFADHLASNGFSQVLVLEGGYKAFRRVVLELFSEPMSLSVLGGYTGSGKTRVLQVLQERGYQTVDLEGLARHKGSAFGSLGEESQPRNEQFENQLFTALQSLDLGQTIWLEDESTNIGRVAVPKALFDKMTHSRLYFLDVPVDKRIQLLCKIYGGFPREALGAAVDMIAKRLGGERTAMAHNALDGGNISEAAGICLQYYDKAYRRSMERRDAALISVIPAPGTDPEENADLLLDTVRTEAAQLRRHI